MFLGGHDQTAGHAIQPMHNSGTQQSADGGLLIEVPLEHIRERTVMEVSDGVRNESCGFINDDQPGIFVNDIQGRVAGVEQFIRGFDESNPDVLSCEDAVRGFGGLIIDRGESGGDEAMQTPGGVVAKMSGQEGVDAGTGEETFNDEFDNRNAVLHG
jgi:hypothetical protein